MTRYSVNGSSERGGAAEIEVFGASLRVDASASRDMTHPGPAELLCSALAACLLKNVERFSQILPFQYESARVDITAERQDSPPRFTRFHYRLEIVTDEPQARIDLLHRNVRKFGTVSGTLSEAAALDGELIAVRSNGSTGDEDR